MSPKIRVRLTGSRRRVAVLGRDGRPVEFNIADLVLHEDEGGVRTLFEEKRCCHGLGAVSELVDRQLERLVVEGQLEGPVAYNPAKVARALRQLREERMSW